MGAKSAQFAQTCAVFAGGVAFGYWLRRPREAPKLRTYDREAASEAQAAEWRAERLREELKQRGKQGGNTA